MNASHLMPLAARSHGAARSLRAERSATIRSGRRLSATPQPPCRSQVVGLEQKWLSACPELLPCAFGPNALFSLSAWLTKFAACKCRK